MNERVELSAPRTIGAEPERSTVTSSPRIVELDLDPHVGDVDAVRVEVVDEASRCRRATSRSRARTTRSVWSTSRVISCDQPLGAVALGQLVQRAVGDRARGELRVDVAHRHARDAHVGADHAHHVVDRLAVAVEADPRQAQALLEDLGVVARARARQPAAHVAVVRDRDRVADVRARRAKTGLTT